MKRTLPLVVGSLGLLGCAAVVLLLTYRHNIRVDLTASRGFTLSAQARHILEALDRDVRVTVFVRSEDPRTPGIKDLLWRIGHATPRVTYEFVDINRSPARARRYGVDRYGALVFECEGRRRDIGNPDEALMMSAILSVTRARERVVYFVTGHGERSPTDGDRKTGWSLAATALSDEQFVVRELSLLGTAAVPADAAVVVIAGPEREYLPEELAHLDAYTARGGNLLLLLELESPAALAARAAERGVVPLNEIVVDPAERLAFGEGMTFAVAELERTFLVSRTLGAPPVLSNARALRVDEAAAAPVVGFLETSPSSYGVVPGRGGGDDARQSSGPLAVGVAVFPRRDTAGATGGRLLVYGDADFGSNRFLEYKGNKDLLLNSVNWLVRDDLLIGERAHDKRPGQEQFFVTSEQFETAFWLAVVVQPAIFLGLGAVVLVRRRRR
jgi:hypothetical protein